MPNQKVYQQRDPHESQGVWAQEGGYDNTMPGGAFLNIAEFAADFIDPATGRIVIPDGTLVGRTYAERDAEVGYGPADPANDEQIFLTMTYISDGAQQDETPLYRHGRLVAENWLPGYDALDASRLAWIRQHYHCFIGSD